ncbi:MAG TPA: hypothetical protein VGH79_05275 [Gaiellaceae bacterium]
MFVALAVTVVVWFAVAPHLAAVGTWPTVVIVSAGVLPGTLLLVFLALPLERFPWFVHLGVALGLGLVAFGLSQAGWPLAENFAKLWAGVFAGWAFLYLFYDVSLIVVVAAIIPFVDAYSVFAPGAPTHEIVNHHISIYNDVAVVFVGPHGASAALGPPDILFYALFLGAAHRFNLRPGWTWLATTGLYAITLPITVAANLNGLPALPFLSLGFLGANADLLWKVVRKRA